MSEPFSFVHTNQETSFFHGEALSKFRSKSLEFLLSPEKLNVLSIKKNRIVVNKGEPLEEKYLAFRYVIDGEIFEDDERNPLAWYDVIDEQQFSNGKQKFVILNRCGCGCWGCDSMLAYVQEDDETVRWKIQEIRSAKILREYVFDKSQYARMMAKIHASAEKEQRRVQREKGMALECKKV